MDPRSEQRLVGVDVAHPGDPALIEDEGLDRRGAPSRQPAEVLSREGGIERLDSEPQRQIRVAGRGPEEQVARAEAPRVDIEELMAAVEAEADPAMHRLGRRVEEQRARHPEMKKQE